jgi:hypothetical protein
MSDPVTIPAGERGVLRLFRLDPEVMPIITTFRDPSAPTPKELGHLLGLPTVPTGSIDLISLADVSALGLRAFLIEGHDVLPEAVDEGFAWLDDLTGYALIVHASIAARATMQIENLPLGVTYVGAFAVGAPPPTPLSLPEAERPVLLSGPPAKKISQGRGRMAWLVALAAILGLVIWLARGGTS